MKLLFTVASKEYVYYPIINNIIFTFSSFNNIFYILNICFESTNVSKCLWIWNSIVNDRVQTLNLCKDYHYLVVNSTDETKENNRISIS